MATFYTQRNNGVVAVIRAEDAALWAASEKRDADPFKLGVRVFAFCDHSRLNHGNKDREVFTGSLVFLEDLRARGHRFEANDSRTGWNGFVPFSNQEHRIYPDGDWKKFLTTAEDVVEKFELLR